MQPNPPEIPLYHITHVDNLPLILEFGGLWCDRERNNRNLSSINLAHQALKERRLRTPVPLYPDKTLGDFVPFYFTNRSPMLYALHTGFVKGYMGGQDAVIYLVTNIEKLTDCGSHWCFTDGHAVEAITGFYIDIDKLSAIDWPLIQSWRWKNTDEDNDRKRRKQAEFLVEKFVPFTAFSHIVIKSKPMQEKVLEILNGHNRDLLVTMESQWYY